MIVDFIFTILENDNNFNGPGKLGDQIQREFSGSITFDYPLLEFGEIWISKKSRESIANFRIVRNIQHVLDFNNFLSNQHPANTETTPTLSFSSAHWNIRQTENCTTNKKSHRSICIIKLEVHFKVSLWITNQYLFKKYYLLKLFIYFKI